MRIVLLGAPGSGKGTQAARLKSGLELAHISTGDLLRAEVKAGTPLGLRAKAVMECGQLVSDEIVLEMLEQRLAQPDCAHGFILDGYPRNLAQASALDRLLKRIGQPLDVALMLHVDSELLFQRLAGRAQAEGRKDDNPETVRERLRVYEAQTAPVIGYYRGMDELTEVDGVGEVEVVYQRILDAIRKRGVAV
jgi:adenylate kinase